VKTIQFDITTICNLSCSHCYMDLDPLELDIHDINHHLAQSPGARVNIGGGEPFMHGSLKKILELAALIQILFMIS